MSGQNVSTAVMQRRTEAPDSLDFFPTPPWATRALTEYVMPYIGEKDIATQRAWEPAAGEGHMAEVLRESFGDVFASDIHDYGKGYVVGDFTGGAQRSTAPHDVNWIISNPPFNSAGEFAQRAVNVAQNGVALLLRTAWLEGQDRWKTLFSRIPPTDVGVFVERVAMVKGKWDPAASSATAYSWFVWRHPVGAGTRLFWIPPGSKQRLSRDSDIRNFTTAEPGSLFAGMDAAG